MSLQFDWKAHAPELLTGVGIAGMIVTAIFVGKSTLKCSGVLKDENMSAGQKLKEVAPYYIPAVISGVGSAVCVVGSMSIQNRRNAALAAAASFAEMTLKEYSNKVVEVIGENKEQEIRDQIAKDRYDQNPPNPAVIQIMDDGKMLCCDMSTNTYFRASKADIDNVENELNYKLRDEMYVALYDYYYALGISNTTLGNLKWNIDNGPIEFKRSYAPSENGTACLYIDPAILY